MGQSSVSPKTQPCFKLEGDRLLLKVLVQPGASRSELAGQQGDRLKIRLQAPPVEGKANRALIKFLADLFSVRQRNISLIRGETSRQKDLEIEAPGILPADFLTFGQPPDPGEP